MLRLDGKVALVIGLGQTDTQGWGIGAACAVLFARQGATIFGGNRTIASTAKTRQVVEEAGQQCDIVETDATCSASVKALVDACVAKHGRIDVLLTNVGGSQPGTAASMPEATWDAQLAVNLTSAYLACHHALPAMAAGGAVVCVSSIAGLRHIGKDQIAYSTAKAALLQFVRATAVSCAGGGGGGVRVNAVVPGLMDTPYVRGLAERFPVDGGYEAFRRMRDAQVPMGRMGDAWDVAHAALFLAADEAGYITGQSIVVDGGITGSTGRT